MLKDPVTKLGLVNQAFFVCTTGSSCMQSFRGCGLLAFPKDEDDLESPVVCVGREDVKQALNEMKTGRALGPLDVSLELIAASRGV